MIPGVPQDIDGGAGEVLSECVKACGLVGRDKAVLAVDRKAIFSDRGDNCRDKLGFREIRHPVTTFRDRKFEGWLWRQYQVEHRTMQ